MTAQNATSQKPGAALTFWLLTVGEPLPMPGTPNPRLLRTGRLARLLTERGHRVVWWTSAFDHFAKNFHVDQDTCIDWEGGQIRLLKSIGYQRNVSFKRFVEHAGVARKFLEAARHLPRPDLLLASLPTIELAHASVTFGQAKQVPVLLDIRDLWPDVLVDVLPAQWRWLSRLALRRMILRATQAMAQCQGLIGVSSGYLDWALRYADRPRRAADAVIPLGYVAPVASQSAQETGLRMAELGIGEDRKICLYLGTFGRQYDLAPVLEAAAQMQADGRDDVQFVICGEGELGPRWREMAKDLRHVVFTGWVGANEINWLRARAAIGLQPYSKGAPQGLANKLFEYISAGLPVVSSLTGENAALIAEHDCGFTYQAGNGQDCARQLAALLDDPARRLRMGENARRLFQQQFDADSVFDKLMQHLETVATPISGPTERQPMR